MASSKAWKDQVKFWHTKYTKPPCQTAASACTCLAWIQQDRRTCWSGPGHGWPLGNLGRNFSGHKQLTIRVHHLGSLSEFNLKQQTIHGRDHHLGGVRSQPHPHQSIGVEHWMAGLHFSKARLDSMFEDLALTFLELCLSLLILVDVPSVDSTIKTTCHKEILTTEWDSDVKSKDTL